MQQLWQKEIDIIQPEEIFCLGGNTYELLIKQMLKTKYLAPKGKITIHQIYHYAAHGKNVNDQTLINQVRDHNYKETSVYNNGQIKKLA
ncbi:hypothetical protein [Oenococcus sicerae]|uniref:Uncharacterized protein n=1 Tax=Oenococcus sicerae TaxID=2203724 RepID=A0AAJ1VNH2_9LACO|nr:hypothetical protein [Oenococcus sicerae]MDN6899859.1 hypothetical protein [Oenococcus sicerae]